MHRPLAARVLLLQLSFIYIIFFFALCPVFFFLHNFHFCGWHMAARLIKITIFVVMEVKAHCGSQRKAAVNWEVAKVVTLIRRPQKKYAKQEKWSWDCNFNCNSLWLTYLWSPGVESRITRQSLTPLSQVPRQASPLGWILNEMPTLRP